MKRINQDSILPQPEMTEVQNLSEKSESAFSESNISDIAGKTIFSSDQEAIPSARKEGKYVYQVKIDLIYDVHDKKRDLPVLCRSCSRQVLFWMPKST